MESVPMPVEPEEVTQVLPGEITLVATEPEPESEATGSNTPTTSSTKVDAGKSGDGETATSKQASIQAGSISNLLAVDATNVDSVLDWSGCRYFL